MVRPPPCAQASPACPPAAVSQVRSEGRHHSCEPGPAPYRQRRPEQTVLYKVVAEHLETFLDEGRRRTEHGFGYPRFIEQTFRKYLSCGIWSEGFARVKCRGCGDEFLLPLSCKGRGVCPSCQARRMVETAAVLTDDLLPQAPYRHWVLSLPRALRFLVARDPAWLTRVLEVFLNVVFACQRRRARRCGLTAPRTGAVTCVQRFGGAVNLNPHLHSTVPDGVFVAAPDGRLTFAALPPPTDADIEALCARIARRVHRLLERAASHLDDELSDDQAAALHAALAESIDPPVTIPSRADDTWEHPARRKQRCAVVAGFSLHANVAVEAHDRAGLERLLRYGLRSALASDRLSLTPDGKVRYELKRPWPNPITGVTELVVEPVAFLRRLACLIPPPRVHTVRYHGVLSPSSPHRALLPPPPPPPPEPGHLTGLEPPHLAAPAAQPEPPACSASRAPRMSWAQLIARVWSTDVLRCPRCGGQRVIVSFITQPAVINRILTHLRLPTAAPTFAPARAPPQLDWDAAAWQ